MIDATAKIPVDRGFSRAERLKSAILIGRLFREGQSLMAYPLRVVWMELEYSDAPAKIAIAVPKRTFKTAVARNLLKRRIREAWRLNKAAFYETLNKDQRKIVLLLMYVAKEELPFQDIEQGVKKLFRKFPPVSSEKQPGN